MTTQPEHHRVRWMIGGHRYQDAEVGARRLLDADPNDEWALRLLSVALANQGRLDDAQEAAETACRVRPGEPLTWVQLADVKIKMNEPAAAIAAAERAVALTPHEARCHHTLGRAFMAQRERYRPRTAQDPERGLEAIDEAIRLSPDFPPYELERAWALVLLDRRREAALAYRSILERSPEEATAINGLGWLDTKRRPILAARLFAQALAIRPDVEMFRINLKGALLMWIYRMVWIWLCGGTALGLVRWVAPRELCLLGLVALATTCAVGTVMILRHVPPAAGRLMWSIPQNATLLMLVRLAGYLTVAVIAVLAPPAFAFAALGVLFSFILVEWKYDFTNVGQRLSARLRRS